MSRDAKWRIGSKNPLNVYRGAKSVCQCHNPVDAATIVGAMKALGMFVDHYPSGINDGLDEAYALALDLMANDQNQHLIGAFPPETRHAEPRGVAGAAPIPGGQPGKQDGVPGECQHTGGLRIVEISREGKTVGAELKCMMCGVTCGRMTV